MTSRRDLLRLAALSVGIAAAACSENSTPIGPDAGVMANRQAQESQPPSAGDLSRRVPGFGGFFLDRDGVPTVYLLAGSERGAAEQALAGYLSAHGLSASAVRVREAKYRWDELERFNSDATLEAFSVPGAVFVDNDETSNRVRIGVETFGAAGQVRAAIARLGIPDDAVIVEQAEPIVQVAATNLQGTDRPVRAGVQINFPGYLCSVGFNATTSGGQKSFVTASHCTSTQGGVENTPYWQPLQSVAPTQIAVEVADPAYFKNKNGCPRGRVCRFSDASRAAYANNGNDQGLGLIARTASSNVYGSPGYLDITGSFSITTTDETNSVVSGTVNKVGRTTGWTAGQISATCVNTGVSGTNIVQLCQTFVSSSATIVRGGDSGSGVWVNTGNNTAQLVGILWGGNSSGTLFVYSPLANVFRELGTLTTH